MWKFKSITKLKNVKKISALSKTIPIFNNEIIKLLLEKL